MRTMRYSHTPTPLRGVRRGAVAGIVVLALAALPPTAGLAAGACPPAVGTTGGSGTGGSAGGGSASGGTGGEAGGGGTAGLPLPGSTGGALPTTGGSLPTTGGSLPTTGGSLPTTGAGSTTSGLPVTGTATTGVPVTGTSTTGLPVTGTTTTGLPATGTSTTGLPVTGTTTTGLPATGTSTTGLPVTGTSTTGLPVTGTATTGLPVTGTATTGIPLPTTGIALPFAARATRQACPAPAATNAPAAPASAAGPAVGQLPVHVRAKHRLRTVARRGLRVRVRVANGGSLAQAFLVAQARRVPGLRPVAPNVFVVGRAQRVVRTAGAATLTLRLSPRAARSFRKRSRVRLLLAAGTLAPSGEVAAGFRVVTLRAAKRRR